MIYKVYQAIQGKAGGKSPQIRGVVFLPSVFEKEAKKSSAELPALHRANAYACFKELEYLTANPQEIENRSLDAFMQKQRQIPYPLNWYPFNRAYSLTGIWGQLASLMILRKWPNWFRTLYFN